MNKIIQFAGIFAVVGAVEQVCDDVVNDEAMINIAKNQCNGNFPANGCPASQPVCDAGTCVDECYGACNGYTPICLDRSCVDRCTADGFTCPSSQDLRLLQKQTGQTPSQPKAKPKPKPKAKRSAMSLGDFHKKTPGGQQDSWRDRGGYDQPTGSDEIYVPRAKRESKGKSKGKSRLGGNNIVQPVPDSDSWAAPALPQNNNNNSSSWSQGAPQAATDALWAAPVPAAPALPSVDDWGSGSPVTMPVVPALPSADDWGTSSPPECTSGSPEDTGGFVEENKNIDWGKLNQNESDQNNLAVVKTEQFVSEESHKAVQGLTAFMTELKLSSYLDKAKNWCDEMGAVNLQEVWEEKDDFMAEIGLKPLEMKRLQKLTEDDIERLMNSVESNVQAAASSVDNIWGQSARPEVVNQANTELEGMAKHCLEQAMGQGSIQKLQQAISEAKMVSSNVCTKFAEERLQLWKNLDGNLDLCMTTFEKSAKQLNDFMNDAMESNFRIDVAKFERRLKELQNNDQKNIAEADLDTALQSPREIDHLEYAISAAYDFGIDTSHHEKVLAMMKKGEEVVVCLETAVDDNDEQGIVLGLDMSKNHKVPEELIEKAKSKLKEFEDEREKERLADIKRKEKKAKEQQQLLEKDRNLAMEKVNLAILAGKPVKLNSAIKEAKRLGADVLEAEKIHQKLADCEQKLILLMSGEGSKSKDLEDCVKSCKECRLEFDEKEVDKKLQKARELERKLEGENKFERALMSREEEKIENCLREFKDVLGKDKVKEAKGVLKDIEKERKVAEARAGLEAAIAEDDYVIRSDVVTLPLAGRRRTFGFPRRFARRAKNAKSSGCLSYCSPAWCAAQVDPGDPLVGRSPPRVWPSQVDRQPGSCVRRGDQSVDATMHSNPSSGSGNSSDDSASDKTPSFELGFGSDIAWEYAPRSDISALKSAIVAAKSKGLDDLIKTAKDIVHTLEKEAEHAQKQKEAASRIEACIAAEDLEDLKLALKMAKHLDVNVARAEEFVAKFELREKQNDGRKQLQMAVENKNIDDLKVAIDLASGIEGVDVTFAEEALRGLRRAKMQDLLKTAMGDNDTCELQIAIKSAEKSKELGLDDDILRAQEHLKAINDCHEANKKLSAVLENDVTNPSLDDSEYQKKLEAAVVLVTKSKVQSIIDVDLLQQGKTKLKEFEAHHVKKGDTKAVLQMAITSRDIGKLREAIATGKEFSLDVSEAVSLLEQLEAESELSGAVGNRDPERIQHVLDSYKILLGEESIASAEKVIAEIQTLKRREKARSDLKTCMADASIANVQSIKDVIVRCKELSLDVSSEEQTVFALQQLSSSIKSRAVHELRHSISSCENLSLDVSAAQAVLLEVEQEIKMKQAQDEAVEELQS
eukprot:gene9-110_t